MVGEGHWGWRALGISGVLRRFWVEWKGLWVARGGGKTREGDEMGRGDMRIWGERGCMGNGRG